MGEGDGTLRAPRRALARTVTPALRAWQFFVSGLLLGVSLSLLLLTEQTDRFFAWTVTPPLTAAFLGAGYAASAVFQLLAARERLWIYARIAPPGALLFTGLTLLATLLHLERFHLGTFVGAFWLAIYAAAPPAMLVLLVQQLRAPGADPPRRHPLPAWLRVALGLEAALMVPVGLGLFVAPPLAAALWPWALTPLTARAVGAWLLALGAGMGQIIWENDRGRVRIAVISLTLFAGLQLLAVARYPRTPAWGTPQAVLYSLSLASLLLVAGAGWFLARRTPRRATAADGDSNEPSGA